MIFLVFKQEVRVCNVRCILCCRERDGGIRCLMSHSVCPILLSSVKYTHTNTLWHKKFNSHTHTHTHPFHIHTYANTGGCSCAGPFSSDLLGMTSDTLLQLEEAIIINEEEVRKHACVFTYMHTYIHVWLCVLPYFFLIHTILLRI